MIKKIKERYFNANEVFIDNETKQIYRILYITRAFDGKNQVIFVPLKDNTNKNIYSLSLETMKKETLNDFDNFTYRYEKVENTWTSWRPINDTTLIVRTDGKIIIVKDTVTGAVGKASCNVSHGDTFDMEKGFKLAYLRCRKKILEMDTEFNNANLNNLESIMKLDVKNMKKEVKD